MAINFTQLKDWLRRRVGDTGPIIHWSEEYLKHAIEEAIVQVANDIPEGFTKILDLALNADKQTIDLPDNGIVFTRVYGEVGDNGRLVKTLIWMSETDITDKDPCWRENNDLTHAIFSDDQHRIWLNSQSDNYIRCSVAMLPEPLIDNDTIRVRTNYKNIINYAALFAMYGLTTNGAQKMSMYEQKYLQGVERIRSTGLINIKSNAQNEKRKR